MREILFRGKRLDNGEWVDGSLFVGQNGVCEILSGTPRVRLSWEVDPSTVGQYAGLKDKNGQRVFEGDVVILRDERFVIEIVFAGFTLCNCEVIGTIHDNPELPEGETL